MRRIAATTRPGETEFTQWATVIFDEKTLLPYFTEIRLSLGDFIQREFDGVHVKQTRTTRQMSRSNPPDSHLPTTTSAFDLPEPAFAWIEGVGLPVRLALPLREGLEGSVPVISASDSEVRPCLDQPCVVTRMSYRVLGREQIEGISGQRILTWKISVPVTKFTFWISCKHPRLEGVTCRALLAS